jgi:hypothetical protein
MKLFDFIDVMFTDKKTFESLNDKEKSEHFFMVNRRMAIKFPIQANYFNKIGMNPLVAMIAWYKNVNCKFINTKKQPIVPPWVFTKTKTEPAQSKTWTPSKELERELMIKLNIDSKTYKQIKLYNKEKLYSTLLKMEQAKEIQKPVKT